MRPERGDKLSMRFQFIRRCPSRAREKQPRKSVVQNMRFKAAGQPPSWLLGEAPSVTCASAAPCVQFEALDPLGYAERVDAVRTRIACRQAPRAQPEPPALPANAIAVIVPESWRQHRQARPKERQI